MSEPNRSTPSLRYDLAAWIVLNYEPALVNLYTEPTNPEQAGQWAEPFLDGIPEWEVRPYRARLLEDLPSYLIDIRLEQCTPGSRGGNARGHVVTVHLVAPREECDVSGELDAMLSALLDSFTTTSRGLRWTSCEYVIRDDFPAYAITLSLEDVA